MYCCRITKVIFIKSRRPKLIEKLLLSNSDDLLLKKVSAKYWKIKVWIFLFHSQKKQRFLYRFPLKLQKFNIGKSIYKYLHINNEKIFLVYSIVSGTSTNFKIYLLALTWIQSNLLKVGCMKSHNWTHLIFSISH